jgi:hypothetical protein
MVIRLPLYVPFIQAFTALVLCTAWAPGLHLNFFAPFLVQVYYAKPFEKALRWAVLCGVIFDFMASEHRFGIMTLTAVVTTFLLYAQKKHFFEDKSLAFLLFSAATSATFFAIQFTLITLLDKGLHMTAWRFCLDLAVMALLDGLFAFLWFTCPIKWYKQVKKRWKRKDDPA